jgi:Zn ribbon nucleic-acid-binding protein
MIDKRTLARQAFETEEPFKAVAARIRTSPNTLRVWWVEWFGKEAFDVRGKRLQSKAASAVGHSRKGCNYQVKEVTESCSSCGAPFQVNLIQKARSKRLLCDKCSESERGVDRTCPVCNQGCVGVKGLAMHIAQVDDLEHDKYQEAQEDSIWVGQEEGIDFVQCLICGHRAVRIDRHVSSGHSLSVVEYRAKFPNAEVQSGNLKSARSESATRQHQESPRKGLTKEIRCPSCNEPRLVGLTFAPGMHESRCPDCIELDEELRWSTLVEGQDYVTCQACGYRAESLVSHIRNAHSELEGEYQKVFLGAQVIALNSTVRVKTEEHKKALSDSANPWRKGLNKETDPRIEESSKKLAVSMKEIRSTKFWRSVDLIQLDKDVLSFFKLKNGKISVGRAMAALDHAFVTIKRECERHGLEVSRKHIQEALCLENLSQVLGGAAYEVEWSPKWAVNPITGWSFRYDGYFPKFNLVVEFHGYQHWTFPNFYFKDEAQFFALQERDRIKENLIHSDPTLRYFLVREDEPYADPGYLLGRLMDEGVLDPGK